VHGTLESERVAANLTRGEWVCFLRVLPTQPNPKRGLPLRRRPSRARPGGWHRPPERTHTLRSSSEMLAIVAPLYDDPVRLSRIVPGSRCVLHHCDSNTANSTPTVIVADIANS